MLVGSEVARAMSYSGMREQTGVGEGVGEGWGEARAEEMRDGRGEQKAEETSEHLLSVGCADDDVSKPRAVRFVQVVARCRPRPAEQSSCYEQH